MKTITIKGYNGLTDQYEERIVEGEPVELLDGFEFCSHRSPYIAGQYVVTELSSGRRVATGHTAKSAIKEAQKIIAAKKDVFAETVARTINNDKSLKFVKHESTFKR